MNDEIIDPDYRSQSRTEHTAIEFLKEFVVKDKVAAVSAK